MKRKLPKSKFWEPNEYGEYGIVAVMENYEHWRERRKREKHYEKVTPHPQQTAFTLTAQEEKKGSP